jgi:hypothetical protein
MRMQSRNAYDNADGLDHLDPYMTCPEAVISLLHIERDHLPKCIWEPACGTGVIVRALQEAGFTVLASDIHDYGFAEAVTPVDYFTVPALDDIEGIITNPPYDKAGGRLPSGRCDGAAEQFARKAIAEVPYVALLLRTNFLEAAERLPFFTAHPPTRVWIASSRLPMMHRYGWTGPRAPSNTCHAWFIWDRAPYTGPQLHWYDWKEIVKPAGPGGRPLRAAISVAQAGSNPLIGKAGGSPEATDLSFNPSYVSARPLVPVISPELSARHNAR